MIDLSNNTVLITGEPASLREGISRQMKMYGAQVHIENMAELDNISVETIEETLKHYKQINTLILLPSWYRQGLFVDASPADWDTALQQNYEHAVYWTQSVAKHMIARKIAGSIIIISSIAINMPMLASSIFATSMAALYPLAKMAAVDCGVYGIRVNTIATGWIESEWTAAHMDSPSKRAYIEQGIPLGHIGAPEMIGDTCCFLASPLSRYITGSVITVDGGYTLTRSEGASPFP